ncbi:MAG TPA: cytochrome C oxidase subunit IV family protein [Acidimicrobiales bacterium]|nr:cytochrome C oxidase subunit IV family protein [Acidimicrobiales bacterium]
MSGSGPVTKDESTGPVVETPEHEGGTKHDHPGERQYIVIALILAVVTAVEVAFSYWEAVEGILAPSLILLSIVKFFMVVGWFMHLRFDSRLFRRLFVAGILLAIFCYSAVLATFHVWTE